MVLPDGASVAPDGPSAGRRGIFIAAGVALLAGVLTLGALTTPDPTVAEPIATSTTSTTETLQRPVDLDDFSVAQIAVGEPLEWSMTAEIEGSWPVTVTSHEGWLFVFTSVGAGDIVPADIGRPSGYHAYFSIDGSDWSDLGPRIPTDGFIANAASTPFGLVAVASDSRDGTLSAWVSSDGVKWARSEIDQPENTRIDGLHMASNSDLVVIAGTPTRDGTGLLVEKLADYGLELDLESVQWGVQPLGEDWVVTLHGPLGLPAMEIPMSELGLTDEERSVLQGGYQEQGVVTWATTNGVDWVRSTIGGTWVESVTPGSDGEILMFASLNAGSGVWRTSDGTTWERVPESRTSLRAMQWRDRLVGVSNYGAAEIVVSSDAVEWADLGLADHFPSGIGWYTADLAAGDSGIAAWVTGSRGVSWPGPETEPLVMERDGAILTLDLDQGIIRLDHGELTRIWQMWTSETPDGIVADLLGETVTFLDEEQIPITSFTFDELVQAERAFWNQYQRFNTSVDALAFTANGEDWTIQDLDAVFGDSAVVLDLQLADGSLIAVIAPTSDAFFEGLLQIWTAPIP